MASSQKPKCYVMSPLGFSPLLEPAYQRLLDTIRPIVEPINPFFIVGEKHIPGILRANGKARKARWNAMALELYHVIRDEADMGLAIVNDEDLGVGCELGYAYYMHEHGDKNFPVVIFRDSMLRGGETDNNLNAMLLPSYLETGGEFVDDFKNLQATVRKVALKLIT